MSNELNESENGLDGAPEAGSGDKNALNGDTTPRISNELLSLVLSQTDTMAAEMSPADDVTWPEAAAAAKGALFDAARDAASSLTKVVELCAEQPGPEAYPFAVRG
jgi:hypothetical protein